MELDGPEPPKGAASIVLPPPPSSVLGGGDRMPSVGSVHYAYKPSLGAVPTLSLPSILPDLPMVADNVSWSAGAQGALSKLFARFVFFANSSSVIVTLHVA